MYVCVYIYIMCICFIYVRTHAHDDPALHNHQSISAVVALVVAGLSVPMSNKREHVPEPRA